MAEILSQSEIDELLKALRSGELDINEAKNIQKGHVLKVYDFKRPNKLSKEQLRTIGFIFENFSRALSTFLSGYLRTNVEMEVNTPEQITYYEFIAAASNVALFTIMDFAPLKGSIIMQLYNDTVYTMVDRILGGNGEGSAIERDFSEIELALMRKIINRILTILGDAWQVMIDVKPKIERIETNVQFIQIVSHNEVVVVIPINVRIGKKEGFINFCIPYMVIEPIVPKLTTKSWFSGSTEAVDQWVVEKIENRIKKAYVDIRAILGSTHISVSDFIDLGVGDVIRLDNRVNDDIIIMVDGKAKFRARPGLHKKKLSVKITGIIEGGEDDGR